MKDLMASIRSIALRQNVLAQFAQPNAVKKERAVDWAKLNFLIKQGKPLVMGAVFEEQGNQVVAMLPGEKVLTICALINRELDVQLKAVYDLTGLDLQVTF